VEDVTPPTRQRTFAPPPPNIEISKAPLSGNIETVLNDLLQETELASTEIKENEVALPASAFTGESPSIPISPDEGGGEAEIFVVVEEMPQFPGGDQALLNFLYGQLRYPAMALDNRIEGVVVVQFIINEKGKITNPKILRGIGGGCDEEALRVISLMPDWKPGRQRSLPVRVRYNLPIRFELKK
jgi:protein TonB